MIHSFDNLGNLKLIKPIFCKFSKPGKKKTYLTEYSFVENCCYLWYLKNHNQNMTLCIVKRKWKKNYLSKSFFHEPIKNMIMKRKTFSPMC